MTTPKDPRKLNQSHDVVELLRLAHEGNQEALSVLLENYRTYLLLIANGEMDARLQAKFGASDVVQQSLISANTNFARFKGDSEAELKAWLRTILKNDLFKHQRNFAARKRNAKREINLQGKHNLESRLVDGRLTPSSEAVASEKRSALQFAFQSLTAQQQQVIRLRNFERMSFVEIGEETGRSADSARKFWARSVEALKSAMKDSTPGLFDDSMTGDPP